PEARGVVGGGDRGAAGGHLPRGGRRARPGGIRPLPLPAGAERRLRDRLPRPRRARAAPRPCAPGRTRPAATESVPRELRPPSRPRPARLTGRRRHDPGARRTVRIGIVHGRKYYLRNITTALDALAERDHELVFAMSERKAFTRRLPRS